MTRGIYLAYRAAAEAVAYFREAARLAAQAGDNLSAGTRAAQPVGRAGRHRPRRRGGGRPHRRRAPAPGRRPGYLLAIAIGNLVQALLMLGDWDAAEAELTQAVDADGLADIEFLACYRGWLAALRGDAATAETMLAGLRDLRASEDPQDKAIDRLVEAFTAAARRQPAGRAAPRPRRARSRRRPRDQPRIPALGVAAGRPRRPRAARHRRHPRAARPARLLPARAPGPHAAGRTRPGPRPPGRRDGDPAAGAAFAAAISGLRETSTPYHLAHGLLDHAAAPQPPGRRRGRRGRHRRSPRHRPAACAASRCSTARKPSSLPGPAPRPRDDRIGPPRPARCPEPGR